MGTMSSGACEPLPGAGRWLGEVHALLRQHFHTLAALFVAALASAGRGASPFALLEQARREAAPRLHAELLAESCVAERCVAEMRRRGCSPGLHAEMRRRRPLRRSSRRG